MRFSGTMLKVCLIAAGLAAASASVPALAGDDVSHILGNGQDVGSNVLAEQRGAGTTVVQTANANVQNNTVVNSVTGSNNFGGFGQSEGMFTVFQNTGNDVVMQSQTNLIVNLQ